MTKNWSAEQMALLQRLDDVFNLAAASKWRRLWASPTRYIYAITIRELVRRRWRSAPIVRAKTFYDIDLNIKLPASTDIYLTQGKTHIAEIKLARYMIQYLRPDNHVMDIGAHYGYFSLLASRLVGPTGYVSSFEASPNNHAVLITNTAPMKNIRVIHKAVSDRLGSVDFYDFPNIYSEYNSTNRAQYEQASWFNDNKPVCHEVETIILDDFLIKNQMTPSLIKIDVEGAELKVIRGLQNHLSQHKLHIAMEYIGHINQRNQYTQAANLLRSWGYKSYRIQENGRLKVCDHIPDYLTEYKLDADNIIFHNY